MGWILGHAMGVSDQVLYRPWGQEAVIVGCDEFECGCTICLTFSMAHDLDPVMPRNGSSVGMADADTCGRSLKSDAILPSAPAVI